MFDADIMDNFYLGVGVRKHILRKKQTKYNES